MGEPIMSSNKAQQSSVHLEWVPGNSVHCTDVRALEKRCRTRLSMNRIQQLKGCSVMFYRLGVSAEKKKRISCSASG